MKVALAVLSVLAVASVASAQLCANYEFRSNPSDFGVQGTVADTIAVWNTLSTQSGVVPTNNFDSITDGANGGNGQNYAARFQLNFILPVDALVDFYAGIDFGLGGYASLDGTITDLRSYDLWWSYDITNSAQVLHAGAFLRAGPHSLDVLGFEGCCGGANSIYFSVNNGPLSIVTCDALTPDGFLIVAPQWYANTPAIVTSDDSSVTVSLATDEAATTNCIVVGASQPAPTRGQIGSLDWYGSSASGRVSTNQTPVQLTLSGLLCGVTYDVYCSATGTAGDLMADADVYGNVLTFTTTGAGCFDAACAGPNPSGSCSTVVNSNTKFVSLSFSKPEHYHNAQNSCA